MSILSYNGGAVLAMKGKECVAIASDLRFGAQLQTIGTDFDKIFQAGPKMLVGLPGLATDTITVQQRLKFRANLYELRENRKLSPKVYSNMIANLLYEHRFGPYFVEPVLAGLDENNVPFICAYDLIGCANSPDDFVLAGTPEEQMFGMCESLYKPDLSPAELFEVVSQCLVNACDRDAISGWGAKVYVIEKDKITVRNVRTRMD